MLTRVLDLPVQVRDSALTGAQPGSDMPISDANRNFMNQIHDQQLAQGLVPLGQAQFNPVINRMARRAPYYERNRAHVCSFWLKGNCNRGIACPFRFVFTALSLLPQNLHAQGCDHLLVVISVNPPLTSIHPFLTLFFRILILVSRHEKGEEDKGDLAHQNIKDRYYGVNDPVAKKILSGMNQPKPEGDKGSEED